MKINSNSQNIKNYKNKQNINFRAQSLPITQINDKGLKLACGAITSLGIASLAINQKKNDKIDHIKKEFENWKSATRVGGRFWGSLRLPPTINLLKAQKDYIDEFNLIMQQVEQMLSLEDLSGEERFMQFLKVHNPKEYDKLQRNKILLLTPKYQEQIADLDKLYSLKDIIEDCKDLRGTEKAEEIYENYLQNEFVSENSGTAEHIKDLCRQINKDFGVKVFLPSNLKETGVALKLIYQELACYKMHAQENGAKAVLPPTLEFFIINEFFVKDKTIVGGCSSLGDKSIQIKGLSVETIKSYLRHELAHANELKHISEFPEGFNPEQYEQIFRDANISDENIKYGQTSPAEFLATAAQGDMSKYSHKLRESLKSLGMPKWMLNMPANFTQADIDKVARANMVNPERKLDTKSLGILKAVFGDSMDFAISISDNTQNTNSISIANLTSIEQKGNISSFSGLHIITGNKLREKFHNTPELDENVWWRENFEDLLKATEDKLYISGRIKKLATPLLQKQANYARKLLLEKVMNDPELYNNSIVQSFLGISKRGHSKITSISTIEECNYMYSMMKKIASDNRLQAIENVEDLLFCFSKKQYDFRCTLIDRILNDEKLSSNASFMKHFVPILSGFHVSLNEQTLSSCLKILDKITSDERLYKNEKLMGDIDRLLYINHNIKSSQMVVDFFDTVLNHTEFSKNSNIIENIGTLAERNQKERLFFLNTIYGNDEYKNNKVLMENLENIVQHIVYENSSESMIKMLEKIYSNDDLKNNKNILGKINDILIMSSNDECCKHISRMMDLLFSKEEYKNNKGLMENADKIILEITSQYEYDCMSYILEKLFSKPEYQENKNLMHWAHVIVKSSNNETEQNVKSTILGKLFSKEEYKNNKRLMEWAGKIVGECHTEEAVQAKEKMLEVFFSKEEYKNNERLMDGIGRIINNCKTIKEVESKTKILELLFGNEKYKNNEELMQRLDDIVNSCSSPEDVIAKQKVLDLCLTDKKLTENQNIQECIGYIITNSLSNNKVLEMVNKYLSEPLLNNNENVKKYAGYIIAGAQNEHMTKLLDKYLEEPKLNQNPNVQSMIGDIIVYTNKKEVSECRLMIIDAYLKFPEWHENESIQNELGNIIKRCRTTKQVRSSLEFFQKYNANKNAFEQKYGVGSFGKILSVYSVDNIQLLEQAANTPNLNKDKIPNILKASYIEDLGNDAGGNAGHIDDIKVQRFINLLQNTKIAPFVVKLLNEDVDMDTASFLAKTKQGFYQNQQDNNNPYIPKNSNYTVSQIQFATTLGTNGMKKGEIDALVKSASNDGEVDREISSFTLLLLKNGFPSSMVLNEIKSLWDDRIPNKKPRQPQVTETVVSGRTRESIKGLERKIIEQYQPKESIWRSEEATKKWAEEKYNAMKTIEYISTRNTAEDPMLGDKISRQRAEMLDKWYEFMETDPEIKDNPFAKITILKAITEDLLPENSKEAVEFDKNLAKKIIADSMNDVDNVSFRKAYMNALKAQSQKGDKGEKIDFDGVRGMMFTVPQTDSSSEDFAANVAKVKAYSDGTNWCIRSWNAAPYIQQGAMHFFVDEHGLTQVCIREGSSGQVAEIQQRQQNGNRPVPYITAVKDYMDRHEIKYPENYLDDALAAKPNFDKIKKELQTFVANKDYKGILEKLGITVTVKPDGTWELSHYKAQLGNFTLNDLGINENELLANVSSIRGDADFANSNATSIPKLQYVYGQFNFIGSNISDIRNLREINGFKINWE